MKAQPAAVQAPETAGAVARRLRLASPMVALALGGLVLALMVVAVPLARLAHQTLNASDGALPGPGRM